MATETVRCACGRLHQFEKADPSNEVKALQARLAKTKKLVDQARGETKSKNLALVTAELKLSLLAKRHATDMKDRHGYCVCGKMHCPERDILESK